MLYTCSKFLLLLSVLVTLSESFLFPNISPGLKYVSTSSKVSEQKKFKLGTNIMMQSSTSEDGDNRKRINNEKFLEEASRSGYPKIKSMSIEERTRRAMLAEAAEDRVVMLSDELDSLLGDDGMPLKVEYREEVTILAQQIKASRDQYKQLVNGDDCASLDVFMSKSSDDSDDYLDLQ